MGIELCYLKLILLIKEVYMSSELTHTRHPTTFVSLPREPSDQNHQQKYLVIDSENQDQLICKKQVKFKQSTPSSSISNRRSSVIVKSRGQSLANFMSYQIYPQHKSIDIEIRQTEKEISCLQKECRLLQSMINDMAAEQAKILVEVRTKERRLTAEKIEKIVINRKNCPIHSEAPKRLDKMNEKAKKINQSVLVEQIKSEISLTTPLFTINYDKTREIKNRDEAKTIAIDVCRDPLKIKANNNAIEEKKLCSKRKVKRTISAKSKQNERASKPKKKV